MHLHLLHPEFLEDALDRSIELEWLAQPGTRLLRQRLAALSRAACRNQLALVTRSVRLKYPAGSEADAW